MVTLARWSESSEEVRDLKYEKEKARRKTWGKKILGKYKRSEAGMRRPCLSDVSQPVSLEFGGKGARGRNEAKSSAGHIGHRAGKSLQGFKQGGQHGPMMLSNDFSR